MNFSTQVIQAVTFSSWRLPLKGSGVSPSQKKVASRIARKPFFFWKLQGEATLLPLAEAKKGRFPTKSRLSLCVPLFLIPEMKWNCFCVCFSIGFLFIQNPSIRHGIHGNRKARAPPLTARKTPPVEKPPSLKDLWTTSCLSLNGCFLKWWYPQNAPKWSFLVGTPWLLGTTILGNPLNRAKFNHLDKSLKAFALFFSAFLFEGWQPFLVRPGVFFPRKDSPWWDPRTRRTPQEFTCPVSKTLVFQPCCLSSGTIVSWVARCGEVMEVSYWLVVSHIVYVHPYLGKIPILTHIFQRGWSHQLGYCLSEFVVVFLILGRIQLNAFASKYSGDVYNDIDMFIIFLHCGIVKVPV